jgi:glycosyltransferase involved in cell wall biosynthesis
MLFVPRPVQRYIPDGDAVIGTFWAIAEHMREYQPSKGVQFYLFQHYETWGGPQERVDAVWKSSLIKVVISTWLLQIGQMLKATDMTLIPNGIDHARFKMHQPIENRPPRVAMMYSNIPWKGSSDGLAAVLFAKQRIPELQAILFGVGDRGSDVPDWIEYRKDPSQDELVEEIYNRAAIFLCSSHTEGFALPPAEAMACGCAVVSTDCGGIRDFSENGTTALLSPPKCPEALGKNLARLLEDDSMRRRIACSGRTRIQKFTWDRSVEALEKLIQMRVDCVAKSKV